jgi:hypothetical protein
VIEIIRNHPRGAFVKPSVGRIVHVFADPRHNNGADVAPAVITRVWLEDEPPTVNVRVLLDGEGAPPWLTSVPLYDTREDAEAAHARLGEKFAAAGVAPLDSVPHRAFWPPRVQDDHKPGDRPERF